MDGPQRVGVHVVRLHTVDAEHEGIYKYEDGKRLQRLDGVSEEDEEEQKAD